MAVGRALESLYDVIVRDPMPRNTETFAKLAGHARAALSAFEGEITSRHAALMSELADYYSDHHRYREAESSLKEAIRAWRELDKGTVARLLGTLAEVYDKTGRLGEAEHCYAESTDIQAHLATEDPADEEPYLAARLEAQANFYQKRLHRFADAEQMLRRALLLIRPRVDHSEYNRRVLSEILNTLGILLSDTQRTEEAESCQLEAASIERQLAAENSNLRDDLASTLGNLAVLYNETGRTEAAIRCHEEALQIRRNLVADDAIIAHLIQM